ncbi:MotA/TolQ/ExbB proton channel family protein [Deltaproteobacteria bacterium TL4]
MKDTLGTIFGFLFGVFLIFFGITWPDHLSNYYMYQLRHHETIMIQLKEQKASSAVILEKKKEFQEFQDSWEGSITRFIDLKSILIVLGGAYAATMVAFPFNKAMAAILFMARALRAQTEVAEFLDVYDTVQKLATKRVRNELITDEEINAVVNKDFRRWLQDFIAVDLVEEEMMCEIVRSEIEMYNYRSFEEIDVLEFMGAATPAFGMIGTVVGLILMLGQTGTNVSGVMGGMSVALITTLYGVMLAQLIFLPIASKRYQLKESHVMLMEMIRESLVYLKRRELPEVSAQDLIIYLPWEYRNQILEKRMAALRSGDLGL